MGNNAASRGSGVEEASGGPPPHDCGQPSGVHGDTQLFITAQQNSVSDVIMHPSVASVHRTSRMTTVKTQCEHWGIRQLSIEANAGAVGTSSEVPGAGS